MINEALERPALLIIDMVKDNFEEEKDLPFTRFGKRIIDPLNPLIKESV